MEELWGECQKVGTTKDREEQIQRRERGTYAAQKTGKSEITALKDTLTCLDFILIAEGFRQECDMLGFMFIISFNYY